MKQKNKEKKTFTHSLTWSLISLLIVGFIVYLSINFVYSYTGNGNNKFTLTNALIDMVNKPKSEVLNQEYITVLLLGTNQKLTDSIILVRYNTKTKKTAMLSIPRDTYVGKGLDKRVNSLYAWKGIDELRSTIEGITGIKIDYHVMINTKALVEVVDALGGVEANVPVKMDYDDPAQNLHIHLQPGLQILNGTQAEGFVRMRKCFAEQDLARVKNQREFLKSLAKTIVKPNNILKINNIIDIGLRNTESDMTIREMIDILNHAKDSNFDSIISETIPGEVDMMGGRSYVIYDKEKTKKLVQKIFIDDLAADTAGDTEK